MNWTITIRVLPVVFALSLRAQTIESTIGGSQLNDAYGIKNNFKWRQLSGWTGIGYNDGFKLGAYLQIAVSKESHVGAGDQWASSYIDTDEYDAHAFSLRGLSFNYSVKTASKDVMSVQVLSGWITKQYEYPFLLANSAASDSSMKQTALTAVLYRHRLSRTVQTHAVTIWDGKLTSIGSIGWKPSSRWEFAGAAGTGSNAAYCAARGNVDLKTFIAGSSYIVAGKAFHREELPYYSTEPVGWNAHFEWIPMHGLKLALHRDHQRTWFTDLPEVESTANSASVYGSIGKFQLGSTLSGTRSNMLPGLTRMEMFSVSRRILPRWRSFGAYISMDSRVIKQETFVSTNEIRVNPRLTLRQNFSRVNGANSFTGGVTWLSNRLSFSVDNEVYASPLAASFGEKPLFQAWTFNIRVRTPHGTTVNANTYIDPTGKMQWGGYLNGLRYQRVGTSTGGEVSTSFSKYVIRGKVVNEAGKGVWGIALQVGPEVVYSDTQGEFFLHVKSAKPLPLTVVSGSSLQSAWWKLQSAPATVHGAPEEDSAHMVVVEVQMNRTMAAK